MNKFLMGLAVLLMAASCKPSGNSGATGLSNETDSMSYAYGAYFVTSPNGLRDLGIDLKPDVFHDAYVSVLEGQNSMNEKQAIGHLQAFGAELNQRGPDGFTVTPPSIDMDTFAYAFAVSQASQFKELDIRLNSDALKSGIVDGYSKSGPKMDSATLENLNKRFFERRKLRQQQIAEEMAIKNQAEGMAFLEDNKTKPGVNVTASGLQYIVVKKGKGASPKETDIATVHYEGTFIDGEVFDSSIARGEPAKFPVNRVIPGWTEALKMMKPGSKWQIFVPGELAYGQNGYAPNIEPNKTLIFDVELISFAAP